MKTQKSFFFTLSAITVFCFLSNKAAAQIIDTLIDVGGYKLNFYIVEGKGMPILFETGGGNDLSVWHDILQPIHDSTGATLITYSRSGFGKSEFDSTQTDILSGIKAIETGLSELGYTNDDIMLVCHPLGGFYTTLFASRNSDRVKGAVLFDANHSCFFTDEQVKKFLEPFYSDKEKFKKQSLPIYFTLVNFENTAALMRTITFPKEIPVIDLVAEFPPLDSADAVRWKDCHKQFILSSPDNRESILAKNSGHDIYEDDPELAVESIVRMYRTVNSQR